LLNVKADSSLSTGNASADNILKLYTASTCLGGGLEIRPFAGLLIGARYQFQPHNLYKQYTSAYSGNYPPPSASGTDLKTKVLQVFIGYRF